jgi:hypothetical protein
MSDDFSYTLNVTSNDRVLSIQLHGGCHLEASLVSLRALAKTLAENPLEGLLIDYSHYHLTFEMDEFAQIADVYCSEFPAGFPVAFVYNEAEVARAIYMTRRLEESGRPCRAFEAAPAALAWLDTKMPPALPEPGAQGSASTGSGH